MATVILPYNALGEGMKSTTNLSTPNKPKVCDQKQPIMKYSAITPSLSCWCCEMHAPQGVSEATGLCNPPASQPNPRHLLPSQSQRLGALYSPSLLPTKPHMLVSYSYGVI